MIFKRFITALLSLAFVLSLFGCAENIYEKEEQRILVEAISLINYFLQNESMDKLSVTEINWQGEEVISSNNIFVARAAHRFGVDGANEFCSRLEAEFLNRYSSIDDLKEAPAALLCDIILFMKELGKDPTNFCGYNLINEAVFFNDLSLDANESIYAMPLMLDAIQYVQTPQNAIITTALLIEKIFAKFANGGFSYNMGEADVDTTAIVLLGLSNNGANIYSNSEYARMYQEAKDTLSTFKNEDGTYKNFFSEASSSSTALVLSLGLEEMMTLSILTRFKNSDGGYRAGLGEGLSDDFSSKDVLQAYYRVYPMLKEMARKFGRL